MKRRSFHFAPLVAILIAASLSTSPADAQNPAVLAEVYGRGVHAYYAGRYNDSYELLSSAIDSGTRDPRAYYFRGILAHQQGRPDEARADWTAGAELEAKNGGAAFVGRSLSRFQGSPRLELEAIRQQARLDASKQAASRSDARMRQLGVAPSANPAAAAANPAAPSTGGNATPPPSPPAAAQPADPFADDGPAMAAGEPNVESPNALEGLDDNPFKDDPVPGGGDAADAGAMPAGGGNPFDGAAPAAGNDPFGAPAGGGNDPFGAPPAGGDDPFGGDPFGN